MKQAHYLIGAIDAAVKAGETIMEVYQSNFAVEAKEDRSPLTLADKKAHDIIRADLVEYGMPLISEEGKSTPYELRKEWATLWIVDPLDGTKEFIKRNGEFTVNIALIDEQRSVMGVVYAPVLQWLYFASTNIGAYKLTAVQPDAFDRKENSKAENRLLQLIQGAIKLPVEHSRQIYTIVGSRSHGTPELEAFVEAKRKEKGDVEFIAAGSSLKICLVAEGAADIYPRLGPTMEWDTAAGQAIAECAGTKMYVYETGQSLNYNKENILNPWFVVER
ncbi:MAG: 3'(2'),5'-bisphosphate nucleotidase CysQ [Desulfobacteraceae bacterium]|jgi:3'(2'), 5'-bisphosphate nucleotidase